MIKLITIGSDRTVFDEKSAVRKRLEAQARLFSELHVIVFTLKRQGLIPIARGNLLLYPTNSSHKLRYIADAAKIARTLIKKGGEGNQVVSVQDPFESGLSGVLAVRGTTVPLHVQIHTDFLSPYFKQLSLLNRIRVFLARFVLPRAASIRVVSERIKESLVEQFPKLSASIVVLPVYAPAVRTDKKADLHERFGHDAFVVLMTSRLEPEKDLRTALSAFLELHKRFSKSHLVIVGEGSERSNFERAIKDVGFTPFVHFEGWKIDTKTYFADADVFLATSRFEGYGLVFIEAALARCPIVSTDVGIVREVVPEKYRRFIAPVGDADTLAKNLIELAEHADLRKVYGSALTEIADRLAIPEAEYWQHFRQSIESSLSR